MELIEKRSQEFRDCAEQCNFDTNARTKKDTTLILEESAGIREQLLRGATQAQRDGKEQLDHLLIDSKAQADRGIEELRTFVRAEVQGLKETIFQSLGRVDPPKERLLKDFLASDGRLDFETQNSKPGRLFSGLKCN